MPLSTKQRPAAETALLSRHRTRWRVFPAITRPSSRRTLWRRSRSTSRRKGNTGSATAGGSRTGLCLPRGLTRRFWHLFELYLGEWHHVARLFPDRSPCSSSRGRHYSSLSAKHRSVSSRCSALAVGFLSAHAASRHSRSPSLPALRPAELPALPLAPAAC